MRFNLDLPGISIERLAPHLSDAEDQPFHWPVSLTGQAIELEAPSVRYGLNVFWRRPGQEPIWITCDNGGAYYGSAEYGPLSLAREVIQSRTVRNRNVLERYQATGFAPEESLRAALGRAAVLVQELGDSFSPEQAQAALIAIVDAGEALELAYARSRPDNPTQYIGCDARQMYVTKADRFRENFQRLFNYATVTFYVTSTGMEDFEPNEGEYRFGIRDLWISWLEQMGITVEGRPILWFHSWVTPEWLSNKSYEEARQYTLRHAVALVGRYRSRLNHWEVINEAHDWANRLNLSHDETIELTRYACQVTHQINPQAVRLINNTDAFGTYAGRGTREDGVPVNPQWTPYTFLRDLVRAEVPFEVAGVQIYRPYRDLSDIARSLERYESLGRTVYITELGVPGTDDGVYAWTPESQAEWVEKVFTVLLPRPNVGAVLWYDFVDVGAFLPAGGLVDRAAHPKPAYECLERLLTETGRIPRR